MAVNFMELLGALTQSNLAPSSESRMQRAADASGVPASAQGGGLQGALSSLMSGAQMLVNRAEQAAGGKDNLAAAGIGALLGALAADRKSSTPLGAAGGGLMGMLGMMAFKALQNAGQTPPQPVGAHEPRAEVRNLENDAQLILAAMLDAAKSDGAVDADELSRITGKIKEAGIGQEGMDYLLAQLQSPMSTEAIARAVQGRPELAAQVYGVSLMAIEVDTPAERAYLDRLAAALGLAPEVARNIEQLVGVTQG